MKKFAILITFTMALLGLSTAHASQFAGPYLGAKLGTNNSRATDTTGAVIAPSERTVAYFMQGGYALGGYNLDLSAVVIGVGVYGDWNPSIKHSNGVSYGSRSYGFDAKLGVPLGDWLPYAKYGQGHNYGTKDLASVSQTGPNAALGFEYKLASHWSTIFEYKVNKFSSKDGSITIKNNTATLGLNYYFFEPPEPELEPVVAEPEPEPIPEPVVIPAPPPIPEVWKTFLEERPVRIEGTNFVEGSAELALDSGKQPLKEVVEFMGSHPDSNLEIIGYTDSSGTEKNNLKLSLDRAESVKKYLVDTGIPAEHISVKGLGSADPVGDNKTEEGRALNRRVEIRSVIRIEKKVKVKEPVKVPVKEPVIEPAQEP